jgi:hypothetical protein
MSESIHPVVVATVNKAMATAQLKAEQLRSKRGSLSTVSAGQQNQAIAVGKALREADAIAEGWRRLIQAVCGATEAHQDAAEKIRAAFGDLKITTPTDD